jgi:1-deoxyxylulose-5-phosphate synthase
MTMDYRVLGKSGVRVSVLSLGTATFGVAPLEGEVGALVHRALDLGINFFDTANTYGNQARFDRPGAPSAGQRRAAEELLGDALRGVRHEVVIATKVQENVGAGVNSGGPSGGGLTRRHIMQQVEESLRRLHTDYIDVYYAHHPDPSTPLDQTLRAFDDLVHQGKIRYVALSDFAAWQLTQALWMCDRLSLNEPICIQTEYNLARRDLERELIAACLQFRITVNAYSPLRGGLLTGVANLGRQFLGSRRFGGTGAFSDRQLKLAHQVQQLANEWGRSPAQLALAWVLSKPALSSAIIGPETIEELHESAAAVTLQLSREQLAALDQVG